MMLSRHRDDIETVIKFRTTNLTVFHHANLHLPHYSFIIHSKYMDEMSILKYMVTYLGDLSAFVGY